MEDAEMRGGTDGKGGTDAAALLLAAALAGDLATLRRLLPPTGATGGMPEDYPVTPLMAAAAAGREAAVELLLECGCEAESRDPDGRTAAWYARQAGHHHLAERLDTVVDQARTLR
jgi:G protein-coupled receptor kinase interactor 1